MNEGADNQLQRFRQLNAERRYPEIIELAQQSMSAVLKNDETAYWLARALIQTGSLDDAASILKQIITRSPRLFQVKADLCKLYAILGKADEAAPLFRELESEARSEPRIYPLLADAYLQAGQVSDAHRALTRITGMFDDAQIDCWLIETLFRMGRSEEGVQIARRVLARRGLAEATLPIAGPTALLENNSPLLERCEKHLRTLPAPVAAGIVDFWTSILSDGLFTEAAAKAADMAVKIEPTSVRLRRLADLCLLSQKIDGAEHAVAKALELRPSDSRALALSARCKIVWGEIETAKEMLLSAIAADRNCAAAYEFLAQIDAAALTPQMIEHLQSLCASETIGASERSKLLLALARRHELDGDYQRAFERLIEGKALIADAARTLGRGYEPAQTESLARSLGQIYSRRACSSKTAREHPRLVFIVGMPRSGTSLVEQILASHPAVYGAGELGAISHILGDFLSRHKNTDLTALTEVPGADAMRDEYLRSLPQEAHSYAICTDKNPLNFWSIGLIKSLFPDAIIIHMNRSAADTCLSILKARFVTEFTCANELESLAHYYACYEAMMTHWRRVFGEEILDVEYETLTGAPEAGIRALISHCELEWDDACLNFHRSKQSVFTHSAAQVRKPINRSAVGSARKYAEQMKPFEEALEKYRATIGMAGFR